MYISGIVAKASPPFCFNQRGRTVLGLNNVGRPAFSKPSKSRSNLYILVTFPGLIGGEPIYVGTSYNLAFHTGMTRTCPFRLCIVDPSLECLESSRIPGCPARVAPHFPLCRSAAVICALRPYETR